MGRIMGIDFGSRRIGVALSDETATIAFPCTVLERRGGSLCLEEILRIIDEKGVDEVVVGLPLGTHGEDRSSTKRTREYVKILGERLPVLVETWDERFTTREAEGELIRADMRRRDRRRIVDKVAAQMILQGYLEHRNRNRNRR